MDNKQDVRVTVSGSDDDGEAITLTTLGTLEDLENGWLLSYQETNLMDMSTANTLVLCEGTRVTVTRTGTLLSTMVFDEKETFMGDYPTEFGSFQMRLYASEVSIRRRGSMGHIRLVYEVNLGSNLFSAESASTRHLDIRFVPCKNQ